MFPSHELICTLQMRFVCEVSVFSLEEIEMNTSQGHVSLSETSVTLSRKNNDGNLINVLLLVVHIPVSSVLLLNEMANRALNI